MHVISTDCGHEHRRSLLWVLARRWLLWLFWLSDNKHLQAQYELAKWMYCAGFLVTVAITWCVCWGAMHGWPCLALMDEWHLMQ